MPKNIAQKFFMFVSELHLEPYETTMMEILPKILKGV